MPLSFRCLFFVVCVSFAACQNASPRYSPAVLQGNWLRISSTDARSDSMQVYVNNDSSTLTFVPITSAFVVGQKKWAAISAIVEGGDFQLYDLSADNKSWKAAIKMHNDTSLELTSVNYPNAPGGQQSWVKIP